MDTAAMEAAMLSEVTRSVDTEARTSEWLTVKSVGDGTRRRRLRNTDCIGTFGAWSPSEGCVIAWSLKRCWLGSYGADDLCGLGLWSRHTESPENDEK